VVDEEVIDRNLAIQIANEHIEERNAFNPNRIVLVHKVVNFGYGWLFYIVTEEYLRTKGRKGLLFDYVSFLVERKTGTVHTLGLPALPEEALAVFERERGYFSIKRKILLIWRYIQIVLSYTIDKIRRE
jgi:hypothetical protein